MLLLPATGRRAAEKKMTLSNRHLVFRLLGGDVRAQAQLEFFGPTLTQKPGSTLVPLVDYFTKNSILCFVVACGRAKKRNDKRNETTKAKRQTPNTAGIRVCRRRARAQNDSGDKDKRYTTRAQDD